MTHKFHLLSPLPEGDYGPPRPLPDDALCDLAWITSGSLWSSDEDKKVTHFDAHHSEKERDDEHNSLNTCPQTVLSLLDRVSRTFNEWLTKKST